jgi:hypothetical protein
MEELSEGINLKLTLDNIADDLIAVIQRKIIASLFNQLCH